MEIVQLEVVCRGASFEIVKTTHKSCITNVDGEVEINIQFLMISLSLSNLEYFQIAAPAAHLSWWLLQKEPPWVGSPQQGRLGS